MLKVKACGICGYDQLVYSGDLPIYAEKIGGHEFSGDVAAVGQDVTEWKVGDPVGSEPYIPCGKCLQCQTGYYNRCENEKEIGNRWKGAFAEYVIVPARNLIKIPDGVSYEEMALLQPTAISVHVLNRSRLRPGERLAVIGCGPIGLGCVQIAKAYGASEVIAADLYDYVLEYASKLGAQSTINAKKKDTVKEILRITGGEGVEVAVDAAGSEEGVEGAGRQAVECLKIGGRAVIVGIHTKPIELPPYDFVVKEFEVHGVWNFGWYNQIREYAVAADMLKKGVVDLKSTITHRFPLTQIKQAFETKLNKERNKTMNVIITFE